MTDRKLYRIRTELPEIRALNDERVAIEDEFGRHPYLYPESVKKRWLEINRALLDDAKSESE